jgi:hypothetical protein
LATAALHGNSAMMELLLLHGADPSQLVAMPANKTAMVEKYCAEVAPLEAEAVNAHCRVLMLCFA